METIATAFDQTFSALQTICRDFEQSPAFRSKYQFLEEREREAQNGEDGDNDFPHYYKI